MPDFIEADLSSEAIMMKDPRIRSAVMFGQGKFNTGVIIDPIPEFQFDCCDRQKFAEFRNLIWFEALPNNAAWRTTDCFSRDSVSKANECAPQHSRMFKEVCSLYVVPRGSLLKTKPVR